MMILDEQENKIIFTTFEETAKVFKIVSVVPDDYREIRLLSNLYDGFRFYCGIKNKPFNGYIGSPDDFVAVRI